MADELLVLKPLKFALLVYAIFTMSFSVFWGVLCYASITKIGLTAILPGLFSLLTLLGSLRLVLQTFTSIGTITLSQNGLNLITFTQGSILYPWSEIKEFKLTYLRGQFSRITLTTNKNKMAQVSYGGIFSIPDSELILLLENWQNHFLNNEELKDYFSPSNPKTTSKKPWKMVNFTISLLGTCLFTFLFFILAKLIFMPSSAFSLQNNSNTPILNIMVKSGEGKETTFRPIPVLQPGKVSGTTLKGISSGVIVLTYTQGQQKICKSFYKSHCLWKDDLFIFKDNGTIETLTNAQHYRNCDVPIDQWDCK